MAGLVLFAPLGKDVRFSPVLAWFLAALNLAVIIGAIAVLAGSRRGRAAPPANRMRRFRRAPARTPRPPAPPSVPSRGPSRAGPPPPPRARPAGRQVDRQILARLSDPDPFLRMSAVAAMRGRVECEGVLVRALNDRFPMVRREVVRALRSTGSSIATETLIKVAAHDPSAEVREEAVAALGALLREGRPGEGRPGEGSR